MAGLLEGVLPAVYSYGNTMQRKLKGLLADPLGTVGLGIIRAGEDDKQTSNLAYEAGYMPGSRSVLVSPEQKALARALLSQKMTEMGAGMIGIVSPAKAQALNTPRSLPSEPLFADAVANTPGAQISGDGLLMRVQRNQAPEQGMRPSVRGGVFYLPEGAAQAKHYSTGRNGYGGSEKIAGETMVSNPVFVKGATGGKAPEAAFDQLSGKGAYQAMREDALRALGSYGTSPADKVARVESFLEKYAPELKDQAAYIVSNSKTGNQLPYALQEAAVASKVRNAGHDAVLGYSKSKSGSPFLSELFDVREAYYPDKFGGFKIWPQYETGATNALVDALRGPR